MTKEENRPHLTSEDLEKLTDFDKAAEEILEEESADRVPFGSKPPEDASEDEEQAVYYPPPNAQVFQINPEAALTPQSTPTDKAQLARINLNMIVSNLLDEGQKLDNELIELEARRAEIFEHKAEIEKTLNMIAT